MLNIKGCDFTGNGHAEDPEEVNYHSIDCAKWAVH